MSAICFANVSDAYQLMKFCKKLVSHFIVCDSLLSGESSVAADFRFALIWSKGTTTQYSFGNLADCLF